VCAFVLVSVAYLTSLYGFLFVYVYPWQNCSSPSRGVTHTLTLTHSRARFSKIYCPGARLHEAGLWQLVIYAAVWYNGNNKNKILICCDLLLYRLEASSTGKKKHRENLAAELTSSAVKRNENARWCEIARRRPRRHRKTQGRNLSLN